MSKEDLLSQIAEVTNYVRDRAEQQKASGEEREGETRELIEKLSGQVGSLVDQAKKSQPYPEAAPLADENARYVENGLFGGRMSAPYPRKLGVSQQYSMIRGTREAEDLKKGQDLHDATVFRYLCLKARVGETFAVDQLARHPDTRTWARWLSQHGYIKDVDTFLNPKSGQLADV